MHASSPLSRYPPTPRRPETLTRRPPRYSVPCNRRPPTSPSPGSTKSVPHAAHDSSHSSSVSPRMRPDARSKTVVLPGAGTTPTRPLTGDDSCGYSGWWYSGGASGVAWYAPPCAVGAGCGRDARALRWQKTATLAAVGRAGGAGRRGRAGQPDFRPVRRLFNTVHHGIPVYHRND